MAMKALLLVVVGSLLPDSSRAPSSLGHGNKWKRVIKARSLAAEPDTEAPDQAEDTARSQRIRSRCEECIDAESKLADALFDVVKQEKVLLKQEEEKAQQAIMVATFEQHHQTAFNEANKERGKVAEKIVQMYSQVGVAGGSWNAEKKHFDGVPKEKDLAASLANVDPVEFDVDGYLAAVRGWVADKDLENVALKIKDTQVNTQNVMIQNIDTGKQTMEEREAHVDAMKSLVENECVINNMHNVDEWKLGSGVTWKDQTKNLAQFDPNVEDASSAYATAGPGIVAVGWTFTPDDAKRNQYMSVCVSEKPGCDKKTPGLSIAMHPALEDTTTSTMHPRFAEVQCNQGEPRNIPISDNSEWKVSSNLENNRNILELDLGPDRKPLVCETDDATQGEYYVSVEVKRTGDPVMHLPSLSYS